MTQLFMLCKLLEMEDKVVASFFLSYLREVPGELFEGVGDDDLVVGERGAEDVELKLVEAVGEDPLGARERPRGLDHEGHREASELRDEAAPVHARGRAAKG